MGTPVLWGSSGINPSRGSPCSSRVEGVQCLHTSSGARTLGPVASERMYRLGLVCVAGARCVHDEGTIQSMQCGFWQMHMQGQQEDASLQMLSLGQN